MEDFFCAGGLPAVLRDLLPLLHGGALTVNGRSIADNVREARCYDPDVIRPLGMPLTREGGTVILFGNLCPDGAVLKQSAASPHLLTHRGRARRWAVPQLVGVISGESARNEKLRSTD